MSEETHRSAIAASRLDHCAPVEDHCKGNAEFLQKFHDFGVVVGALSVVASSIDDVPRGIAFLLNRNRVNVAVSRAQYAAYIVRSPQLTDYLPSSPAGLVELGAFLALTEA